MLLRAEFAEALRVWIEREKLTQAQAAKRLKIAQPRLSAIVRGKAELLSLDYLADKNLSFCQVFRRATSTICGTTPGTEVPRPPFPGANEFDPSPDSLTLARPQGKKYRHGFEIQIIMSNE